jgi:hypothetical protein
MRAFVNAVMDLRVIAPLSASQSVCLSTYLPTYQSLYLPTYQ